MAVPLLQVPEVAPEVIVQLMLPVPVTVPLPVPAPATVTVVALKAALTDSAEFMVTEQAPVPVQAPLQPANADPAAALGVSVTEVPLLYVAEQVPGQLIPAGTLVTEPFPVLLAVRVNWEVKAAETDIGEVPTVKPQAPVPEQAPPQPLNIELPPASWFMVTVVPCANVALHVPGQLIPAGMLATVPEPVVVTETAICGASEKVAPTLAGDEPITKLQAPVPEQAPLQPANTDPACGAAVSATRVLVVSALLVQAPEATPAVKLQLTPPLPVTVPVPAPDPVTVTGNDVGMKSAVTA